MSGIDNDGLDFAQLEALIHDANGNTTENTVHSISQPNLPESPPDSGSEPPYSPSDLNHLETLRTNRSRHVLSSFAKDISDNNNLNTITVLQTSNNSDSIYLSEGNSGCANTHKTQNTNNRPRNSILSIQTHMIRENLLDLENQGNYGERFVDINSTNSNNNTQIMTLDSNSFLQDHCSTNNSKKRKLSTTSPPEMKQGLDRISGSKTYIAENNQDIYFCPEQQTNPHHLIYQTCDTGTSTLVCTNPISSSESSSSMYIGITNTQSDSLSNLLDSCSSNENSDSATMQCIRFNSFQSNSWHILCDQSLQEL